MTYLIWLGILVCLTQSAMFSGSNLAFFSLSRMRLEAEVEKGNKAALKVLKLREDSNFLLCTILWGNVGVNVFLAMLSDSVFTGVGAFIFSTVGITFFGEIMPQAYFSRHAIRVGALLAPIIRVYQILLYPVAKPSALILDGWIGPEGPSFFRERDIEFILEKHIHEQNSEISANEGRGALNFLNLDDRYISSEGCLINPKTIYMFPVNLDLPILPPINTPEGDLFIESLKKHPDQWAIIVGEKGNPQLVLKTSDYLGQLYADEKKANVYHFSHRPIVVTDDTIKLDAVLGDFVVEASDKDDNLVDRDVILYWTPEQKRIITGADIFGRLLSGIARREEAN